jgi:16S rRNA (uracil1498-N3)-methyltransferase
MSDPVFVADHVAGAVAGDVVRLTGAEAHHASVVARIAVGERITVVDGSGCRAAGSVRSSSPELVEVAVESVGYDADRPVVLVQALAKGGRDEQAVESATELGATRIVPWEASRSVVQWKGPKRLRGRAKWESLALKAAKQSRRALIPAVDEVTSTSRLANLVRGAVDAGARVVVLHEEAPTHVASMPWALEPGQELWLVVGPEGGIAPAELAVLEDAGADVGLLGPHVLRASTAGPAAIAAILALAGDWGTRR